MPQLPDARQRYDSKQRSDGLKQPGEIDRRRVLLHGSGRSLSALAVETLFSNFQFLKIKYDPVNCAEEEEGQLKASRETWWP